MNPLERFREFLLARSVREGVVELRATLERVMTTQAELVAQMDAVNEKLSTAVVAIGKVGGETDTILQIVQDLRDQIAGMGGDSAPVTAAVEEALARITASANAITEAISVVDNKVPDAS